MDKEDCIQVLLSALQQPAWRSSNSVTDWDLKDVLWKAGLLLTPEQVAALFSDVKRRGLISGMERRSGDRIVALWGVRITPAGEEWLAQRAQAASRPRPPAREEPTPAERGPEPPEPADRPRQPDEVQCGSESGGLNADGPL